VSREREFGSLGHLVGRFVGALWPGGPGLQREAWALAHLLPGEQELWRRMSGPDRRHAVGVAEDAQRLLRAAGIEPSREVVAAALLHDVGKVTAGLGTLARAAVTAAGLVLGRSGLVELCDGRRGLGGRVARYLRHDTVGAELLAEAGSAELTRTWAAEHHRPPRSWSVEPRIAEALKEADGD
jgi:putative nucleotidyltransferase with HDIG domain